MNRERVTKLIQFILFMSFENKLRLLNEMLNSEDIKKLKIDREKTKKLIERILNLIDGNCRYYITHLKSCSNITMAMSDIMIMDEEEQNLVCYMLLNVVYKEVKSTRKMSAFATYFLCGTYSMISSIVQLK